MGKIEKDWRGRSVRALRGMASQAVISIGLLENQPVFSQICVRSV
jgi:hypothetical protein